MAQPFAFAPRNDLWPDDKIQIEESFDMLPFGEDRHDHDDDDEQMDAIMTISCHHRDHALTQTHGCHLLASSTLQDVKDMFQCPLDHVSAQTIENQYLGYFVIDHCFYYDDRHPNSIQLFK